MTGRVITVRLCVAKEKDDWLVGNYFFSRPKKKKKTFAWRPTAVDSYRSSPQPPWGTNGIELPDGGWSHPETKTVEFFAIS